MFAVNNLGHNFELVLAINQKKLNIYLCAISYGLPINFYTLSNKVIYKVSANGAFKEAISLPQYTDRGPSYI